MAKKKPEKRSAPQKSGKTKKKNPKTIIIAVIAGVLVAAVIAILVVITVQDNAKHILRNTRWGSQTAKNASGDEVDIRSVYNVKYSTYQGQLTFDGENKFELWMSPGNKSDGTHSGVYELNGDTLSVTFDEGTKLDGKLTRKDGKITSIEIPYGEYFVTFYPQ